MNRMHRTRLRVKHTIFIGLLASGLCNSSAVRANETATDKENGEEPSQAQLEAEKRRKKEEAEIKSGFSFSFNDVSKNLVIIECKSSSG